LQSEYEIARGYIYLFVRCDLNVWFIALFSIVGYDVNIWAVAAVSS